MSGTIKFFHPEETFVYKVEQSFCKVVYLKKKNCLVLEIESNDDIEHLDEDSLQNEFPKVILNIDDFPISVQDKRQLAGKRFDIPIGTAEIEDEDGELIEIYYTNLQVNEEDWELNSNRLEFSRNAKGELCIMWTGEVEDFTEATDDMISFEVNCALVDRKIIVED
ncbi:MAG: hypothetical protein Q4G27_06055 [Flavobacteriaceae bacterium]|nr:hypothetical protein [Flavobacteriaceae bacterium]